MIMKRLLTLLALLIGLSLSAFAQAQSKLPRCPDVDYSKTKHTGIDGRTWRWHNCFGKYFFELNDSFKGHFYEGEFQNGMYNGRGTYTFADGSKYLGEFKDGKYNGQGLLTTADGFKLVGEFKDNKPNGQGTFTLADGSKYVGELKDGKFNGQGTLNSAKGDNYVGDFKDGNFNGQGTLNSAKGDNYAGEFKDGKYNGKGSLNTIRGSKFVGEFKDGKPNGRGTLTLADGTKYEGEVKDAELHGKGIVSFSDGKPPIEGIFENGNFVIAEKTKSPDVQQTDVALNEERRKLDADRQTLEAERQRLTEERKRREQAKQSSKLSLQTTTTIPDVNGNVTITVRTNADTSSLKVNGEEQGGRQDGNYTIKKVARVGQDTNYVIAAVDSNGNTDTTTIKVSRQIVSLSNNQTVSLKPENIKRAAPRDAVAIIIGIQIYKRVPKAEFANNDAKDFYEYAIRGLGIRPENIKLLVDE